MAVDEPAPPAGAQHPSVVALIGARFGFSGSPRARPGLLSETSRDEDSRANPSRISSPRRATPARARGTATRRADASSPRELDTADARDGRDRPRCWFSPTIASSRAASRLTTARPPPPSPSRQPPRSQVPRRARRQALAPRRAPGAVRDGRRGGAPNEAHARPRRRAAFDDDGLRRAPRAPPTPTVAETRTRTRAPRAVAVRPGSLGQDPSLASPSFAREARRRGLRPRVVGFRPRGGGSMRGPRGALPRRAPQGRAQGGTPPRPARRSVVEFAAERVAVGASSSAPRRRESRRRTMRRRGNPGRSPRDVRDDAGPETPAVVEP